MPCRYEGSITSPSRWPTWEATLAFYGGLLGAEPLFYEQWKAGAIPVVLMQIGENRLSVHAADAPAKPHARLPTAGSVDICFRWEGPISEAEQALRAQGVAIEEGPVPRPAADGVLGQSVYFRDPDGNLVELLTTDEG